MIVRTIYGTIKGEETYSIRTKDDVLHGADIVKLIKSLRL
jgi:hypothetical protein